MIIIGERSEKKKKTWFYNGKIIRSNNDTRHYIFDMYTIVSNLLKRAGNSYYEGIERNTRSAGIDYYTDNKNLLPSSNGETKM